MNTVMRTTKYLLFSAATALAVFGQGLVVFNNRIYPPLEAPVSLSDGSGPGETMRAGLFLVRNGNLELLETTTFRSGAEPRPRYLVEKTVSVPGLPAGAPAIFRIRVWPANVASYEEAVVSGGCYGEFLTTNGTPDIHVSALGDPNPGGSAPVTYAFLYGILPLEIPCNRQSPQST